MKKFCITIASLPDRENLVAEICYEGVQWVEISQEANESIIQFYSHPRQDYWEFVLDEALEALAQAKKRLLDLEKRRT
ncbi:hypothetical protein RHT_01725 [Candidatus Rhabdochlamydia sp. T3358]|jgi:hypothetical protein|nr:hypothetical protein RHT_01725 [Candidatus Rhabdochlamydia sp. T3358]